MRFNIEIDAVADAATEEDADALGSAIEERLMSLYGPGTPTSITGLRAVLATVTVAAVTEKKAIPA